MDFADQKQVLKLLADCRDGNGRSQHELYKALYGKMLVVCMRYSANASQAKENLQEGFLLVFGKLKTYRAKGSFEGWVRRIMVNHCIDKLRKKKELLFVDEQNLADIVDETEEELEQLQNQKADVLLENIQKLSPAYRMVLNLYIFEGYTHKQIAELLGISEGASKSNYAKAKSKLKKLCMEQIHQIEKQYV